MGDLPEADAGRWVTALVADLSDSTALGEQLEPDDLREVLDDLVQAMGSAVRQHGGSVQQFLGDGIVAVFGAPERQFEPAARAVQAALLMFEHLEELNRRWQARLGQPMRVHSGLCTAPAAAAQEAADPGAARAIEMAIRLQEAAEPSEILVERRTYLLLRPHYEFRSARLLCRLADGGSLTAYPLGEARRPPAGETARAAAGKSRGWFANQELSPAPAAGREERSPRRTATRAEEERKQVTVLFAQLAALSPSAEAPDTEALSAFMFEWAQQAAEIILSFEGSVQKLYGEEILAIFGAPTTHENDPERAVRAALALRQRAQALSPRWPPRLGAPAELRIGINSGTVVAGEIELGTGQAYAVTGDTMNTAARLRSAAQPGQILVGPDTYRLTRGLCDFTVLPPIRVRGKTRPVPAYALMGLRTERISARGREHRGISSPLVGRDAESRQLAEGIERLLAGQGGIIAVIGESGMGKSRLVAEARDRFHGRDLLWLEGRSVSYSREISYTLFREMICRVAGITLEDDESAIWRKLERRLRMLFPEQPDELLPYLAMILGIEVPGEMAVRVQYLDSEGVRRQIFRSARRFFEALARERPLALVFEDLHWADQSSTALLEHLLPLVREVPVLFCGVSRPDPQSFARPLRQIAAGEYATWYTEIRLAALSPADSAQLLRNLVPGTREAGGDDFWPRTRALILAKAEGNPFYVEEVTRTLIDLGAVVRDPATGRWQATAQLNQITIPDTIQGVIMARVDRLGEPARESLRLASVIGRSFFYRVLRAITDAEREIDPSLAELLALEFLRQKAELPEREYIFKHALVQEATYDSLVKQRRRELHRRVAESIESLFADRLEEFYGMLAYHTARAEDWERAQGYLFKAADQAGRIAADGEALAQYQQAVAAYARAFGDHWDPFERAVLNRKIGEALFRRGDLQGALDYLQRALGQLGRPYPATRRATRRAVAKELARQVGHRILPRLFVRSPGGDPDPAAEQRSMIYHRLMWISYFSSQDRLLFDCPALLNESERSGLPVGIVRGRMGLGMICDYIPLPRLAEWYHRRAVEIAEEAQQPVAIGEAYLGLCIHQFAVGRWNEALESAQRSSESYWAVGELRGWGGALNYIAGISARQGVFDRAIDTGREIFRIGEEGGDRHLMAWGTLYWAGALTRAGRLDEAIPILRQSALLCREVPDVISAASADADLGLCYLRQGRLPEALELLEETNRTLDARGLCSAACVPPRVILAEACLAAAAQATGSDRQFWLEKSRRACLASLRLSRLFRDALLGACRVQGAYLWLRGRHRAARRWWQRGLAAAVDSGARFETARLYEEMGRQMGSRSLADQAAAIYDEIGSRFGTTITPRRSPPGSAAW